MLIRVWRFIYIDYKSVLLDIITSVTVTSDNKYIISGSHDTFIKMFDLQTKQLVHHFENAHKGMEIFVDYEFIVFRWDQLCDFDIWQQISYF